MKPLHTSKPGLFDRLLSLIEAPLASDRFILRTLFLVVIFSGVWAALALDNKYSSVTPIRGGTLSEGIVGTPRFINPALAITRADQDVTALIYSGLMKINEKGELVPDLAESITVSDDGLTYNILLRKDVRFHDGVQLTAHDVAFTIELIKNPDLKSPLRGNWNDVSVEEVNEHELNVVLKDPYVPFKENFLVGILPAHLWSQVPTEQLPFNKLNTEPIGSGPFKIKTATRDANGLINSYTLAANKESSTPPKIDFFTLHFYTSEESLMDNLKNGTVQTSAYVNSQDVLPLVESGDFKTITEPLPRIFGIFFNQNKMPALRDPAVREALSIAIDRDEIIATAVSGQGVPIYTPIPESSDTLQSTNSSDEESPASRKERALKILTDAGWKPNNLGLLEKQIDGSASTLSITLRTSNVPLFNTVSQMVADQWKAIGVEVSTEQFEQTGLIQTVIRPRDFEALLFGLDMSRAQDLYPFWHSSQKNDPGLNIAQYTNLSVDALLEKARKEQNEEAHNKTLKEASDIIVNEHPAIFLFEPMMTYVVKKDVVISDIRNIGKPSDRFSNSTEWYTDSDNLWNTFKENN